MNQRSDIDRVLQVWMTDGPTAIPDRVVDVVAARIGVQRQRRVWPFPGRTTVNTQIKLIAALAAAIVLAVVGYNLLPRGASIGSPTAQPSPTATAPAPTAAAPTAPPPIVDGILEAGTYRLRPFISATMTVDATVPGGGWLGGVPNAISGPRGNSNGPNGVVAAFLKAETVHSDPCQWDHDGSGSAPQDGDVEVGPTVDDLVTALGASTAYESTSPVDVTLGGFSGKRLELQLTPGPSGCDSYDGAGNQYWVFGGRDGALYAQGDANRWQVTIVDVAGTRLIGVLVSYAETSAEDLSAAQRIVDSVVITP
jgi:hypothetical protein